MQVFTNRDQLIQAVGTELGTSDWLTITQEQVDLFAQATGDHQWIHVDRERAASGPFGGTIAHGYLTASLLPVLTHQIFKVEAKMGINYGLNKLRFPAPVPVGSSVRATSTLQEVTDVGDAVQLVVNTVVRVDGSDKPAAVAESVSRYYL
jgi:acyl dehydratase